MEKEDFIWVIILILNAIVSKIDLLVKFGSSNKMVIISKDISKKAKLKAKASM